MRTALVDLDDTLLDYRAEEDHGRDAVRARQLPGADPRLWQHLYRRAKLEIRAQTPLPTSDSHFRRLARALELLQIHGVQCRTDEKFVRECENDYWEAREAAVRLLPGSRNLLDVLHARCDRTILCTLGTQRRQSRRLKIAGLDDAFDTVLTSDTTRVGKDHWPTFLGTHWCEEDSYLVVSDTYDPDLRHAARIGMCTAWVRGAAKSLAVKHDSGVPPDWEAATPGALAGLIAGPRASSGVVR